MKNSPAPADLDAATERSLLRKMLRQRRNSRTPQQQATAAQVVLERLQTVPAFMASRRIAMYFATDGELDPAPVLEWCLAHDKQCYAPVIAAGGPGSDSAAPKAAMRDKKILRFAEITAHGKLKNNRFGIAEPVVAAQQLLAAEQLDVVLLPLVGFNYDGTRIGMGGGFYDATFAFKQNHPEGAPQLIGLAHEVQCFLRITAQQWDIPMPTVVTERRVYQCQRREDADAEPDDADAG